MLHTIVIDLDRAGNMASTDASFVLGQINRNHECKLGSPVFSTFQRERRAHQLGKMAADCKAKA